MSSKTQAKVEPAAAATVRVEKLVYGGEGLAHLEGQVVLVPFVLPGEEISIRTERVKSGLLRGSAPQILQSAGERVIPRCEYFGSCGGCHYQHAEYGFQLEQKRQILIETLRRLGGIDYQGEIKIISGEPWFYRNRIQLHFADCGSGFQKSGSHELCAIDHCYISSPVLVDAIARFAGAVKRPEWPSFLRSLELFTNDKEIQLSVVNSARPLAARFFAWCETFLPSLAKGPLEYEAAGFRYRISRGSFFQVNRFLIDALVNEVIGDVQGNHAIDLYAGVGLFSLSLASRFQTVDSVERGGSAFRDLEWNIASRRLDNVRAMRAPAEDFLRMLDGSPDLIIADPPRAGLDSEATNELLRVRARRLKLVSCDPATMARDTKKLLGAYRIAKIILIDLFPQTYHFETILELESN
ncbi:MAG: class I SAM-dependent RNA methyltransferase [Acidobacteriaceae bacterium]|nr:class I SAM-dependent RNA methyltransferase [Acidobacteriaceae bacterium]